ncbi:MAG: glycogen-binding domain-containing protein [Desulfobulbales bacterium]|nr:glycogen-binding domain-containing protein [Desulfobulbales bacterium]
MVTKAKSTGKTIKKAAKKKTATKRKRKTIPSTEFSLYAPNVNEVYLAGDFNDWKSDAKEYRLRKYKGDIWRKMLKLKPGRYEYQFVVDGQWWCDPKNDQRITNPYCTENSVIEVEF